MIEHLPHDPDVTSPEGAAPPHATDALSALLGFQVQNTALFDQALSHRSLFREDVESHLVSNERLEFLGDAVLGFVVAEEVYRRYELQDEGFMTRMRSKLVNGAYLAAAAGRIGLGAFVKMSGNMEATGGRKNTSILADAFEAVLGALYLDAGMEAARTFVFRALLQDVDLDRVAERNENYKSLLLEFVQSRGWAQPVYAIVAEAGPGHQKEFTAAVTVMNKAEGQGTAASKKGAEQIAARRALAALEQKKRAGDDE